MYCRLLAPDPKQTFSWDDVTKIQAVTQTGTITVYPHHAPFFGLAAASPLRITHANGREDIFALIKPTYRIERANNQEANVTITAQSVLGHETDLHISLENYEAQLHSLLTEEGLSKYEQIFIENEIAGTKLLKTQTKAKA
jgi:F0F1-type ATP synthase epsilon subunit